MAEHISKELKGGEKKMDKVVEELFDSLMSMLGDIQRKIDHHIIEMSYIMGKADREDPSEKAKE